MFLKQAKTGGGCCECADTASPCAGCADCAADVPVTLQTRAFYGYGSKCGIRHPFAPEIPKRWFRRCHVSAFTQFEINDSILSGTFAPGPAFFFSRCSMEVSWVDPCQDTQAAAVHGDSRYETNWFSGRPVVSGPPNFTDTAEGDAALILYPYSQVLDGHIHDCWDINSMFALGGRADQPSRQLGGGSVGALVTADYSLGQLATCVIPEPSLKASGPDWETWIRTNDSLAAPADGWGFTFGGTTLAGTAIVLTSRTAKGSCTVTLEDEHTTEKLVAEVKAALLASDWVNAADCSEEQMGDYEEWYSYKRVEYRWVYDYSKRVRIGFKIFPPGGGDDAEIQYVDSPGAKVFSLFPGGFGEAGSRCVNFVSATSCL